MNLISLNLSKYVNKYLSTRVVFMLDMIVSLVASYVTIALVNFITIKDLLAFRPLALWLGGCVVFSFIFIWAIRTYI